MPRGPRKAAQQPKRHLKVWSLVAKHHCFHQPVCWLGPQCATLVKPRPISQLQAAQTSLLIKQTGTPASCRAQAALERSSQNPRSHTQIPRSHTCRKLKPRSRPKSKAGPSSSSTGNAGCILLCDTLQLCSPWYQKKRMSSVLPKRRG